MFGPEEPSCELETIQKLGDQACQFVQQYCEHESLFNFFSVHYCQFGGASYITIPIYLLIIFLWFYIVGTTAEGFLSPALEKVASTLGMSESLAGVTLLAMGNGAPDVLTSVSAAGSEHTGMFFSVGSLAGSGLFVTGVVTAFVIIFSPRTIKVPGLSILRDVWFYMAALITVVIGSIVGELNIYFAIAFFWIYLSYVIVVVIMDRHERKTKKKKQAERGDDAKLKKVVSLNQEDSLEELNSEKSYEEHKTYFYDKSVSQNVNELGQHLIDKESEDKRAMTQDSSGGQEQNNGSGKEWSMVLEEPNLSQDEEHQNQPQGNHIGKH